MRAIVRARCSSSAIIAHPRHGCKVNTLHKMECIHPPHPASTSSLDQRPPSPLLFGRSCCITERRPLSMLAVGIAHRLNSLIAANTPSRFCRHFRFSESWFLFSHPPLLLFQCHARVKFVS